MVLKRARSGDVEGAKDDLAHARKRCETDPDAAVCVATALAVVGGEPNAAMALFDAANKSQRTPPGWYRFVESRIAFYAEEYERSIAASISGPQRVSAVVYRGLSAAMLGDRKTAADAHEELTTRYPAFDFNFYAGYFPISAPNARKLFDRAAEAFRHVAER